MNEQPEALLALADRIDEAQGKPIAIDTQAAAELRRLHEVNAELLKELKRLMDMDVAYNRGPVVEDAVIKARAAIAKAEGEKA